MFSNLNEVQFECYNSYLYVQIKTYNSLNMQHQLVIFLTANCSNPIVFFLKNKDSLKTENKGQEKTNYLKETTKCI